MENELLYVLLALVSVLGLLLIVFVFLFLKAQRSGEILKDDLEKLKKEKLDIENKNLESVNIKARSIIEDATKKASELISGIQVLSENEKNSLNAAFEQAFSQNLKEYQAAASKFSKNYDDFMVGVGKDVRARLEMGINKIISETGAELKTSSQSMNASVSGMYKGYEEEVSKYKKQIFSQFDKLGLDLIKQVSFKVMGKTLTKKEQEDMVIKSLEEAKKLGFFE